MRKASENVSRHILTVQVRPLCVFVCEITDQGCPVPLQSPADSQGRIPVSCFPYIEPNQNGCSFWKSKCTCLLTRFLPWTSSPALQNRLCGIIALQTGSRLRQTWASDPGQHPGWCVVSAGTPEGRNHRQHAARRRIHRNPGQKGPREVTCTTLASLETHSRLPSPPSAPETSLPASAMLLRV